MLAALPPWPSPLTGDTFFRLSQQSLLGRLPKLGIKFSSFFRKLNLCEDVKMTNELETTLFKHLVIGGLLDALISK